MNTGSKASRRPAGPAYESDFIRRLERERNVNQLRLFEGVGSQPLSQVTAGRSGVDPGLDEKTVEKGRRDNG